MVKTIDSSKRYVCYFCEAQFLAPTYLASHIRVMHPVTLDERQEIIDIWLGAGKPSVNAISDKTPRSAGTISNIIRKYRLDNPVDLQDVASPIITVLPDVAPEKNYVTVASLVDTAHFVEPSSFAPIDYVVAFENRVRWYDEQIAVLRQQNKTLNDRLVEMSKDFTSFKLQARQGNVDNVLRNSPLRDNLD